MAHGFKKKGLPLCMLAQPFQLLNIFLGNQTSLKSQNPKEIMPNCPMGIYCPSPK